MITLAVVALLASPQEPTTTPGAAVRIAVRADGSAIVLPQDGTPPRPLFGRMFAALEDDSLSNAFENQGLLGHLGLFLGAPRPLSTMLDPEEYCERAGLKRTPEALRDLLSPAPAGASAEVRRRRSLDRLVALTLLARSEDPKAREAVAQAVTADDPVAAAWAKDLVGARDAAVTRAPTLRAHVASVLARAPGNTRFIVVVDHAHLPRWRDLWRVAGEVGRLVARQQVEQMDMPPDEARTALADADLVVARAGLLPYELARRIGNAYLTRTVVAGPTALSVGPGSPWLHFAGHFEPERLGDGLRGEGFQVATTDGTVQATSATDTRVLATSTSLTIDATAATDRLGEARAAAIAADFDAPHLALGVALLGDEALGAGLPDAALQKLFENLRAIHLRHDGRDGARLWLDLHYTDPKPATVAATAVGGLLTAATGVAGDAPPAIRDLLREVKVSRAGTVVTVAVELDEALGPWVEKLVPQLMR